MRHILIILISFLLLSSPVIGDSHKGETLYLWGEYPDYKWMGFGDKETNPKYQGQVKDGKPNGLGIIISPDGWKYVGSWKNGDENGQGTFTGSNGEKYVGSWKDGYFHGQGTMTYLDGTKYVGGWKDGKEHGQGTLTFPDGGKYVGEFKDEEMWTGKFYDNNGNIEGNMLNGIID